MLSENSIPEDEQHQEDGESKTSVESEETVEYGKLSVSTKYLTDSIDFDASSMRCFKQIELSSSSLFKHPLYFFPELEDPGIFEAFRYEPPLPIDNDIGHERYLRICKLLEITPFRRVLESLETNELDLRFYGLRSKEFRAIFHVLEMNAYIKTLLIQDSWMSAESVGLLSKMLTLNNTITKLDLKQCKIGPEGTEALNEGLLQSLTLQDLDLSFNSIGDDGLKRLKSSLKSNESIRRINLGHNELTSASGAILQQFFTFHECIEEVNLEWNFLCDEEGFKKIAAGLKANKRIKSLNLSWNSLESVGVTRELGRFIRDCQTIEFIDLSNNRFKNIPAMILKSSIGANESLKHIRLGNNPFSTEEAAGLGNVLLQSRNLEILDLENVYFDKSFNATLRKLKKTNKKLTYGGILGNFRIKGPDIRQLLLKRCNYLGLAPKKAKAKRNFGHILLTIPQEPMEKGEFEEFIRKKKKAKMYDVDLLNELKRYFPSGKTKINTADLLSEYMKMYPDTALPPQKPKKEKKKKRGPSKTTSTSSATTTPATTDTEAGDMKVSFVPQEEKHDSRTGSLKSSSSQKMPKTDSAQDKRSIHSTGSGQKGDQKIEEIEAQVGPVIEPEEKAPSEKVKSSVRISERVEIHEDDTVF